MNRRGLLKSIGGVVAGLCGVKVAVKAVSMPRKAGATVVEAHARAWKQAMGFSPSNNQACAKVVEKMLRHKPGVPVRVAPNVSSCRLEDLSQSVGLSSQDVDKFREAVGQMRRVCKEPQLIERHIAGVLHAPVPPSGGEYWVPLQDTKTGEWGLFWCGGKSSPRAVNPVGTRRTGPDGTPEVYVKFVTGAT